MPLKVTGLKAFAKRLKSIGKGLNDRRKVHAESVVLYEQWVKKDFQAQGGNHERSSLKWKKLSDTTLLIRRTRERSPTTSTRILEDSGQLKQRWFRTINNDKGVLKSGQDYSSLHEHGGTSRAGGNIFEVPQRKIFPEKKQGMKIIKPAIDRYKKRVFGK